MTRAMQLQDSHHQSTSRKLSELLRALCLNEALPQEVSSAGK